MFQFNTEQTKYINQSTNKFEEAAATSHIYNYSLKAIRIFEEMTAQPFIESVSDANYIPQIAVSMETSNNTVVDALNMLNSPEYIKIFSLFGVDLSAKLFEDITAMHTAGNMPPVFKSKKELAEEAKTSPSITTFTDIVVTLSDININWRDIQDWHMSMVYSLYNSRIVSNMNAEAHKDDKHGYTDARLKEISDEQTARILAEEQRLMEEQNG